MAGIYILLENSSIYIRHNFTVKAVRGDLLSLMRLLLTNFILNLARAIFRYSFNYYYTCYTRVFNGRESDL